jgi:hypothetical protein
MPAQCYTVTPHPISTILTWVSSNEIAIPEIQRPFVWDATQVRNLMDSLYKGFPVGYLIAWRNPNVRLKDGSTSAGKKILIDGQQRVTALMAAFQGREIVTKDYRRTRIRIAFHPILDRFEVSNPAIDKDTAWISDISDLFKPETSFFALVNTYCKKNPEASQEAVFSKLETVKNMLNNQVGLIELHEALDIETVTEIFIRINSAGSQLSQADFAMSKIATNERFGGQDLRKAIDYFCHLAVEPGAYSILKDADPDFSKTEYWHQMAWLKTEQDDLYDPTYTDMLRVAFTSEFQRGKLEDLVAILSGRNFETKQFEESIAEDAFHRLSAGVMDFMNKTNFQRFLMILRSAGFIDASLFSGQNATNFAYILFLTLRKKNLHPDLIETLVRRWYVLSVLKGRYSSSPESNIDFDIRQIHSQGAETFIRATEAGELSEGFWTTLLPQEMNTSVASSPYFKVFKAAQVKAKDAGFLSKAISVFDLIDQRGDVHHLFPKALLKKHGKSRGDYNQIANYAMAQSEINIAIGHKAPKIYMEKVLHQCNGGTKVYGGISTLEELQANLNAHCIPEGFDSMDLEDYPAFLESRRRLMAHKLRVYYQSL